MAELSLNMIVSQMDGSLAGLEDIFADYKRKLEESHSCWTMWFWDVVLNQSRPEKEVEVLLLHLTVN